MSHRPRPWLVLSLLLAPLSGCGNPVAATNQRGLSSQVAGAPGSGDASPCATGATAAGLPGAASTPGAVAPAGAATPAAPAVTAGAVPPQLAPAAATLRLLGQPGPGYTDTIQTLVAANCTGCHAPGGQPPDLSSYAAVKASAVAMGNAVAQGKMPPGIPLQASDKANFAAWLNGGLVQTGTAPAPVATPATAGTPGAATAVVPGASATCAAPSVASAATPAGAPAAGGLGVPGASPAVPAALPSQQPATGGASAARQLMYSQAVQPLLAKNCLGCHGPTGRPPNLSTLAAASAAASAIAAQAGNGSMPPTGKLGIVDLQILRTWATAQP